MDEKLTALISEFKIPLILASIGIVLAIFSLILFINQNKSDSEISFSADATGSGSIQKKISVDVEGSVFNPGVYDFEEGARVNDAIIKAGGLTTDADGEWIEKNLNKAAKLSDGGKIYIPAYAEASAGKTKKEDSEKTVGVTIGIVNINSASQTELEALPGVGPVIAEKIILGRPYQTLEELKNKKIIGSALYDKIKDKISI